MGAGNDQDEVKGANEVHRPMLRIRGVDIPGDVFDAIVQPILQHVDRERRVAEEKADAHFCEEGPFWDPEGWFFTQARKLYAKLIGKSTALRHICHELEVIAESTKGASMQRYRAAERQKEAQEQEAQEKFHAAQAKAADEDRFAQLIAKHVVSYGREMASDMQAHQPDPAVTGPGGYGKGGIKL